MSACSSDTDLSCDWTVIGNEGSDIETLGPDNEVDSAAGVGLVEDVPLASEGFENESLEESSLDLTLREEIASQAEALQEVMQDVAAEEQRVLCSSSENSDIVTLENWREVEADSREEPTYTLSEETGSEDFMGSSSSSQYTFRETKTMDVSQVESVSSSEDEEEYKEMNAGPVVRRRLVRKETSISEAAEPQEREPEVVEDQQVHSSRSSNSCDMYSSLNCCILLALLILLSMSFRHFYGTVENPERLNDEHMPCEQKMDFVNKEVVQFLRAGLEDKQNMVQSLSKIIEEMSKENQNLRINKEELQAQKKDLDQELIQSRGEMESSQIDLKTKNQQLAVTLEQEEVLILHLQEEMRNHRQQIHELEGENHRLKSHLQEKKLKVRSFINQKEALMTETWVLHSELDKERKVTDKLREELEEITLKVKADKSETEKVQSWILELESKLKFEQQRSDLFERLYVESKSSDDQAKGDRDDKPKSGMMGKMKDTFHHVKNSTKEFVNHHKEQIKKAKEAVEENLRKFSDSVKSTFQIFKDSAADMFNQGNGKKTFQHDGFKEQGNKRAEDVLWRSWKPLHKGSEKSTTGDSTSRSSQNTRKPGAQKQSIMGEKSSQRTCMDVFDCAYEESMSLFNKAVDPVRAEEFNQLLYSYLQKEVGHFHHWTELQMLISEFFQNGLFIHDQMLFTDFVSRVEEYLEEMNEYLNLGTGEFRGLKDYIFRNIFGDTYLTDVRPSPPVERPEPKAKAWRQCQKKLQKPHRAKKTSRSGRDSNRQLADMKIELGPLPFDPKY